MKRRYLVSSLSAIALMVGSICSDAYAAEVIASAQQATKTNSGSIFFAPKGAPRRATGGASRSSMFAPKGAPQRSTGGASRSGMFAPKGAPQRSTGGASRNGMFAPKGAPSNATGGASRGAMFAPKGAPRNASGGASRGNIFTAKGAPKNAGGGASRLGSYELHPSTIAASGSNTLIAVIPQSFYGRTVSERPTIMVHLPASYAQEAVFSLKDEQGNTHYRMNIPVAGKAGIMAVKLPEDAPALEIGKDYQWFLALKVDGELSPSTPYVDGWIQRIQPNSELLQAMQQKDIYKQAVALGKEGVWYDCLAKLASLRASQPNNSKVTLEWQELLTGVNLQDITTAALIISAK